MTVCADTVATETCVWMDAGVLRYRLCDRRYDCEHCPLDAALRGARFDVFQLLQQRPIARVLADPMFPSDRLYTPGHTWLGRAGRRGRFRFGLDGLAASLIACPNAIHHAGGSVVQTGEAICTLEFAEGPLILAAPLAVRLSGWNKALDARPAALLEDPYGVGWILEVAVADERELDPLLAAECAEQQARLDLRRFRRRLALHLLTDPGESSRRDAVCAERADEWSILEPAGYLQVVREFIH